MRIPRISRRKRDEVGATAVIVAMFFAFIALPLGAAAVDIARLYVELERVQAGADAAATAGVTYMPDDFNAARARAIEVAEDNGFPNSGTSAVQVSVGDKPTQLRVTVSSTVRNSFAKAFGVPTSTMSRSALADFNGPAPMGSPCNSFANEPAGSAQQGPQTSQTKVPTYANCSSPQFWGAITGPETWKDQGSEFDARKCGGTEDGCNGSTNKEFDPRGFVYLVRVAPSGVGQSVNLQVYDPAYVETAADCSAGPVAMTDQHYYANSNIASGDNNKYPLATSDANVRYDNDNVASNMFCTGDSDNAGRRFGSEVPTITSFTLRSPVDNLDPYSAPALNPSQCTKQWPGYSNTVAGQYNHNDGQGNHYDWTGGMRERNLRNSGDNNDYKPELARVFHQWVNLCTFTPTQAGDYYLQVRSNVALPASYTLDATGAVAGNAAVYNQAGDNTAVLGNGTNQFAIRAVTGAAAGAISVSPWEKMRIFANADSASTQFNLVRVVPAAANKTLVITYYDVGEATGTTAGSVQVLPPGDAKLGTTAMTTIAGCQATGPTTGALSNCKVNNVTSATNNGKLQVVRVPIPNTYTCQVTSAGGCWFRVGVNFPGATVTDATTWTARIVGEPVRLIE
ncbi:pilus assembly protein TadG-related protein [Nocardioides zeicaulis]|uniref:Pilus assembly protein TadG-related protein n=1 Tax=Nocardioides zeicaulis TaxID=1776857 RepID=A0ABV6E3I2_9ACTN